LVKGIQFFSNVKHIRRHFDVPNVHFDNLRFFSGTQAKKVGNPRRKVAKTV
jgi:hypothetical protein